MRVAPREMMRMHVEALFTRDAAGDLACINEPAGGGGPAPRFFLGVTEDGCIRRFRHDVGASLREELLAASRDEERKGLALPPAPAPYEDIIGRLGATKTWAGPAFTFPERLP